MIGYSYADVVERLFREFEGRFPLTVVVEAVHECRGQLSCVPESAMPEMLERLARQRLNSTPQPSTSMPPEEDILLVGYKPDSVWVQSGSDVQGLAVVAATFAASC